VTRLITILHLYAQEMSIYGDRGNVLTLRRRLEWRGYKVKVLEQGVGDVIDWSSVDLLFAGGGQDRGQVAVGEDLRLRSVELHSAIESGLPVLTICGSYQLLTRGFRTSDGTLIPGIGVFAADTVAGSGRLVGNNVVRSKWGELYGFENHSGLTYLDSEAVCLGSVKLGGNNGSTPDEGVVYKNAYGTYLHGPILPKNPTFADHLLSIAVARRYPGQVLESLDDSLEDTARAVAAKLPR
jgi:lipid II isoglutaminyl synthase (glutamine-hydrolysing)